MLTQNTSAIRRSLLSHAFCWCNIDKAAFSFQKKLRQGTCKLAKTIDHEITSFPMETGFPINRRWSYLQAHHTADQKRGC